MTRFLLTVTWRIPFGLQLVPGGLLLIGCFFLKESPRYLLKRHRPEEATHNLCWLRMLPASHTYIEEELSATVVQINREKEVTAGYRGNAAMRYLRGMWHEVSTPGIRNRIVIGAFIMMWQNMCGVRCCPPAAEPLLTGILTAGRASTRSTFVQSLLASAVQASRSDASTLTVLLAYALRFARR